MEQHNGTEEQITMNKGNAVEEQAGEELVLEDIIIETLAIDGICGVY